MSNAIKLPNAESIKRQRDLIDEMIQDLDACEEQCFAVLQNKQSSIDTPTERVAFTDLVGLRHTLQTALIHHMQGIIEQYEIDLYELSKEGK